MRPGQPEVRWAAVCPKCESTGRPSREFFASEAERDRWRCSEHNQAEPQVNRPYFGRPTDPKDPTYEGPLPRLRRGEEPVA